MRGEHSCWLPRFAVRRGSSPHARGARGTSGYKRNDLGIIPACAGSTSGTREEHPRPRDHPRMRGEH